MRDLEKGNIISSKTILIVEDHDALRESLRTWLSSVFDNCSFLLAKNGKDAIAMVLEQKPEIVLMDIAMPGISGIDTTRRIKDALPETQVIILTIHDEPAYKADAKVAGAFAFVPKHRMYTELLPIIKTLLSKPNKSQPTSI